MRKHKVRKTNNAKSNSSLVLNLVLAGSPAYNVTLEIQGYKVSNIWKPPRNVKVMLIGAFDCLALE